MNQALLRPARARASSRQRVHGRRTLSMLLVFACVALFMAGLEALLALAIALDSVGKRGTAARYLAWFAVAFIVVQSRAAWLYSAFADAQMSMVSLLR